MAPLHRSAAAEVGDVIIGPTMSAHGGSTDSSAERRSAGPRGTSAKGATEATPTDAARAAAAAAPITAGRAGTERRPPPASSSSSSSAAGRTEAEGTGTDTVLGSVLAELERERSRRIDAEARALLAPPPPPPSPGARRPADDELRCLRREVTSLRAERDGLTEAMDALTCRNDAVSFAASAAAAEEEEDRGALPPDVVRLLEIMPWDEGAKRHMSATEEIYEWEMYDKRSGTWSGDPRNFPDDFKSIPVAKPGGSGGAPPRDDGDGRGGDFWTAGRRGGGGGGGDGGDGDCEMPGGCVLTDAMCTVVLDLSDGFALPSRGTWEWIGGWKVDVDGGSALRGGDGDLGWSYASQPKLLVSSRGGGGGGGNGNGGGDRGGRKFRRRRWTRLRVLRSYPSASDATAGFLALRAENARLALGAAALGEEVARMRERLRESEEEADRARGMLRAREEEVDRLRRAGYARPPPQEEDDRASSEAVGAMRPPPERKRVVGEDDAASGRRKPDGRPGGFPVPSKLVPALREDGRADDAVTELTSSEESSSDASYASSFNSEALQGGGVEVPVLGGWRRTVINRGGRGGGGGGGGGILDRLWSAKVPALGGPALGVGGAARSVNKINLWGGDDDDEAGNDRVGKEIIVTNNGVGWFDGVRSLPFDRPTIRF